MFIAFTDTTGSRPTETIALAAARYRERFNAEPVRCLVAPGVEIADAPVPTEPYRGIAKNVFFVGDFDQAASDARV